MKVVVSKVIDNRTFKAFFALSVMHSRYGKYIIKRNSYLVESFGREVSIGDEVEIVSFKPFSKRKRWSLLIQT